MASAKIIEGKQNVVDEITSKLDNSKSVLVVEYQGTNVSDMSELRGKLREANEEGKFVENGKGDYLVRLIGDDLDTILVTDNNGL